MEWPPISEACSGSPDSSVAVAVATVAVVPFAAEMAVALAKLSLTGAAKAHGANTAHHTAAGKIGILMGEGRGVAASRLCTGARGAQDSPGSSPFAPRWGGGEWADDVATLHAPKTSSGRRRGTGDGHAAGGAYRFPGGVERAAICRRDFAAGAGAG